MNVVEAVWVQNVKNIFIRMEMWAVGAIFFLLLEIDGTFVNVDVPTSFVIEYNRLCFTCISNSQVETSSWFEKIDSIIFSLVCWLEPNNSSTTHFLYMTKVHQPLSLLQVQQESSALAMSVLSCRIFLDVREFSAPSHALIDFLQIIINLIFV